MTGGAGHIADMIGKIRMNESAIRRKRWFKQARIEYINAAWQQKLDYTKATPAELERIRVQVILNRKESRKRFWIASFVSLFAGWIVLWSLWELLKFIW
ncbi:MAG: hypothetical protein EA361_12145 [Bacteroidetes bacterium]|nr:MAG: hypothetical protein EA361_12145 [Bacteroidota bacterium]